MFCNRQDPQHLSTQGHSRLESEICSQRSFLEGLTLAIVMVHFVYVLSCVQSSQQGDVAAAYRSTDVMACEAAAAPCCVSSGIPVPSRMSAAGVEHSTLRGEGIRTALGLGLRILSC